MGLSPQRGSGSRVARGRRPAPHRTHVEGYVTSVDGPAAGPQSARRKSPRLIPEGKILDVLALNSGSSSLKFGLYRVESSRTETMLSGEAEAIGAHESR